MRSACGMPLNASPCADAGIPPERAGFWPVGCASVANFTLYWTYCYYFVRGTGSMPRTHRLSHIEALLAEVLAAELGAPPIQDLLSTGGKVAFAVVVPLLQCTANHRPLP